MITALLSILFVFGGISVISGLLMIAFSILNLIYSLIFDD